jgi:hypothetical protein
MALDAPKRILTLPIMRKPPEHKMMTGPLAGSFAAAEPKPEESKPEDKAPKEEEKPKK